MMARALQLELESALESGRVRVALLRSCRARGWREVRGVSARVAPKRRTVDFGRGTLKRKRPKGASAPPHDALWENAPTASGGGCPRAAARRVMQLVQ